MSPPLIRPWRAALAALGLLLVQPVHRSPGRSRTAARSPDAGSTAGCGRPRVDGPGAGIRDSLRGRHGHGNPDREVRRLPASRRSTRSHVAPGNLTGAPQRGAGGRGDRRPDRLRSVPSPFDRRRALRTAGGGSPSAVPDDIPVTAADLLAIEVPSARVTSGQIGRTTYSIQLRTTAASLTQSGEPLILIDGVMISRLGQAMDALSQISASDVESIEVLMGPSATVRYPMAANGVVLVRTRAGRPPR